jgi:hypothetical protein
MGTLTFHCPRTGRPIESGIETDAATMMETASVPVRLICPHCHDEHDPKVREGYLEPALGAVLTDAATGAC